MVVDLERGEHRVVVADVDAGDPVAGRVRLVRLERRGDGDLPGVVPVEDGDELLLLDGAVHDGAPGGVDGDGLPGDGAADPGLPKISLWTVRSWLAVRWDDKRVTAPASEPTTMESRGSLPMRIVATERTMLNDGSGAA